MQCRRCEKLVRHVCNKRNGNFTRNRYALITQNSIAKASFQNGETQRAREINAATSEIADERELRILEWQLSAWFILYLVCIFDHTVLRSKLIL